MSRARDLSQLANENALSVNDTTYEVGINSTSPDADLNVGGTIKMDGPSGVITATSYKGSGSNLTGIAATDAVHTRALTVSGVSTFTGAVNASDTLTLTQGLMGVGATFTGQVSVGGTLTYEDVTQVDSVGIVTARLGVRVLAGGIQVVGLTTLPADGILVGTGASVFQPASNILTLGTNSSERLRINSSGEINTTDDLQVGTQSSNSKELRFADSTRDDASCIWVDNATNSDLLITNDRSSGAIRLATNSAERARITHTGGLSLNNGELIERCNISATALNTDTAISLDNGMVHYRTGAIGAASVKPNIYSSVGINTQMATGDIITVTIITACSSTSNFVDHIMVDHKDVTENWVGGSAPTEGGGSGVDTYAFNIIKTGSEAFTVIGNHVKTS